MLYLPYLRAKLELTFKWLISSLHVICKDVNSPHKWVGGGMIIVHITASMKKEFNPFFLCFGLEENPSSESVIYFAGMEAENSVLGDI